jgi:YidC/Oxa1 family membrane protein insertase
MADYQPPHDPSEPRMDKRMIVAFILMAAILFLTPYFYKLVAPPESAPKPAQTAQPAAPAQAPAQAPDQTPAAQAKPAAPPPAPVSAQQEQISVIETSLYRITFSNRGAVVRSWILKRYKDSADKPLDLVNQKGAAKTSYPFSLEFPGQKSPVEVNQALYSVKAAPDGLGLDYEYSNGVVAVRKSFRFRKDSYLADLSFDASKSGAPLRALAAWRGGFGDQAAQGAQGQESTLYFDPVKKHPDLHTAGDADDEPIINTGDFTFTGIQDKYFAAVFSPQAEGQVTLQTKTDDVGGVNWVSAAVGGATANRFTLFVGPKDTQILRRVDPRLEDLVDFGKWFGWLAKPLFTVLNWANGKYVHNYGWSIVLLTIVINTLILPLRLKSMKSMKKMQALKPHIDAINAKYKNVGLRDPRKADQNAEVMEFYKKHGVNPMGGCLPMLLQLPIFIAFYNVLTVAIEMRGASWLWVTDLSEPERIPIHILPVLMVVAQFFQQKMTPTPGQDPTQAKMMLMMPVVMGVFFYNMSSGLVLYWLTSNLVGIVQQWFINRSMPVVELAAPAPAKPRKGGK